MRRRRERSGRSVVVIWLVLSATWFAAPSPAVGIARAAAPVARVDTSSATIVFARLHDDLDSHEIWTMGARGGSQRRLTRNDVDDLEPVWSPDGTRIAWVRYEARCCDSDIWLMDADGSNKHMLTIRGGGTYGPTWSPDGTQIAFTSDYAIWIINDDGTGEHRISAEGSFEFDPAWSPDGTTLAFASRGGGSYDLFAMKPDGSERRRLVETVGVAEHDPAWSPDGGRLAFSGNYVTSSWHVGMMRSDGAGRHIVTDLYSLYPAWSPDASRLAFYACGENDCGLYQGNDRGGHVRTLGRRRGPSDIQPDFRDVLPPG